MSRFTQSTSPAGALTKSPVEMTVLDLRHPRPLRKSRTANPLTRKHLTFKLSVDESPFEAQRVRPDFQRAGKLAPQRDHLLIGFATGLHQRPCSTAGSLTASNPQTHQPARRSWHGHKKKVRKNHLPYTQSRIDAGHPKLDKPISSPLGRRSRISGKLCADNRI